MDFLIKKGNTISIFIKCGFIQYLGLAGAWTCRPTAWGKWPIRSNQNFAINITFIRVIWIQCSQTWHTSFLIDKQTLWEELILLDGSGGLVNWLVVFLWCFLQTMLCPCQKLPHKALPCSETPEEQTSPHSGYCYSNVSSSAANKGQFACNF